MDKHSFLDGPGLTVDLLVDNVKLVWVKLFQYYTIW